ncbi:MAG: hypothetical protein LBK73_05470 [Treponema sp.]|jgi:hypothetical protein|nr:hypothetical protein [Treponema sp.]
MTTKIRRGAKLPTVDDLENFQLGWSTEKKKLYIRDDTADQVSQNHKIFEVGGGSGSPTIGSGYEIEDVSTNPGVYAQSGPEILLNEKWVDGENIYRIVGIKRAVVGITDYLPYPNGTCQAWPLLGSEKNLGVNTFNIKEWFDIDLAAINPKVILRASFSTGKHERMGNNPVQRCFVNVDLFQYEVDDEWYMLTLNDFIRMSGNEMFLILEYVKNE